MAERIGRIRSAAHGGVLVLAVGALAVVGAGIGLAWGSWNHVCRDCPSIAQIYAFQPKEATEVYAADGSLLSQFAIERRTMVPYSRLPRHLTEAFIAVEDRRFWSHPGIDARRTVRAGLDFLFRGYDAQGGSTVTQQLAGNMFSATVDRRVISVARKLKEMRVALALERAFTKEEILSAYLNQINFGDGHYGVQSAAHHFFGKDARELNLPESALLAALPVAPARFSPVRHPERALERRNLVLRLMADQGMIDPETAEAAQAYPLALARTAPEAGQAPYFVEWIRRGMLRRYGPELYEGGFRVYTSLDPGLQAVADSALEARLDWVEEQAGFDAPTYEETHDRDGDRPVGNRTPYVQGMFIAMDARTGEILAMSGGRDFTDSEFNRATQATRQPGSVFKPIVFTAAIASGIPASEVIWDTPVEIVLPDGTVYSPRNFGGQFEGPTTLREALYRSVNVVAVKLGQRVGEESIAQYARRMGIETEIPRVASAAIGAASVVPLQITEAYSTFANLGIRVQARPFLRVEGPDGQVLWETRTEQEEVLDVQTSWIMLSMLEDVVDRGTGYPGVRTRGLDPGIPVAGKTGTTNEAADTWFIAFTPDIVTATWIGFDDPRRLHRNATGGRNAAPVNTEVLKRYYENHPAPADWPRPDGLVEMEVDRETGMRATAWCPAGTTYTEYYRPGTEPQQPCSRHGPWADPDADGMADSVPAPMDEDFDW